MSSPGGASDPASLGSEIGLHFSIHRADDPGPIVVEVPHAGLAIDPASAQFTTVPSRAREADAPRADADLGADVIWEESERRGVTRVVAHTHRYVIDLNTNARPPPAPPFYEEDPEPRPVIRRSMAGVTWRDEAMPRAELARRIDAIFDPYHAAIDGELARAKRRHRRVLLIASHTFPTATFPRATSPASHSTTADVVLGTLNGGSLGLDLRDAIGGVFRRAGFSVSLEKPFPGGFSLERHGQLADGIGAIQIEVARRLLVEPGTDHVVSDAAVRRFQGVVADVAATATRLLASA